MEKWKFVITKSGKFMAQYWGNSEDDVIMKVWVNQDSNQLEINNRTECEDIYIPLEVITRLLVNNQTNQFKDKHDI